MPGKRRVGGRLFLTLYIGLYWPACWHGYPWPLGYLRNSLRGGDLNESSDIFLKVTRYIKTVKYVFADVQMWA